MVRWHLKHNRVAVIVLVVVVIGLALGRERLAIIPNAFSDRCIRHRQLETALAWLDWTTTLSPEDSRAEFLRARIARRQGRMDSVREHLQRAADFGCPLDLLEREQWLALAQSGQLREAEPHFATLFMDSRGDGEEICEAFVIGYLKHRSYEKASDVLRAWAADFPRNPQPHFYSGVIAQARDAWDEAIREYELALELDPAHADAAMAMAKCYLEKKQPTRALEYYEVAVASDGDLSSALVGQAHCLRELGRTDESLELLRRAFQRDPLNSETILELAQVELETEEFESARQRLQPLVEREPRNHDARYAYATALRSTGGPEEAVRQFEIVKAARLQLSRARNLTLQLRSPDDIELRYQIGSIYLQYGDPAEGVQWLNSVLDFDSDHQPTHRILAEYYSSKEHEDSHYAELAKRHLASSQE